MPNIDFDKNIETLKYLGYVTHNAENEITDTARRVCAVLKSKGITLEDFGNQCPAFAAKYWQESQQEQQR